MRTTFDHGEVANKAFRLLFGTVFLAGIMCVAGYNIIHPEFNPHSLTGGF